jgi:hypothetical protein
MSSSRVDAEQLCALHHLWVQHMNETDHGAPPRGLQEESIRSVVEELEDQRNRLIKQADVLHELLSALHTTEE